MDTGTGKEVQMNSRYLETDQTILIKKYQTMVHKEITLTCIIYKYFDFIIHIAVKNAEKSTAASSLHFYLHVCVHVHIRKQNKSVI